MSFENQSFKAYDILVNKMENKRNEEQEWVIVDLVDTKSDDDDNNNETKQTFSSFAPMMSLSAIEFVSNSPSIKNENASTTKVIN